MHFSHVIVFNFRSVYEKLVMDGTILPRPEVRPPTVPMDYSWAQVRILGGFSCDLHLFLYPKVAIQDGSFSIQAIELFIKREIHEHSLAFPQELGLIRKPSSFISAICDERGQELLYAGTKISDVFKVLHFYSIVHFQSKKERLKSAIE